MMVEISAGLRNTCNICGFERFNQDDGIRCEKCGSSSYERVIIEFIGEELGSTGLPLLQWVPQHNLKILDLQASDRRLPFIDMIFQYDLQDSLMNPWDNGKRDFYDFILLKVEEDRHLSIGRMRQIYEALDYEGELILIADPDISLSSLREQFEALGMSVGYAKREYRRYRTGYMQVLICRK